MTGAARRLPRRIRAGGYSLLELVIVVTLVGVAALVLIDRLTVFQEYGEKAAMELAVRNMRSGLRYRVADLMNRDRMREADRILQDNPVSWLEGPPANYLGELRNPPPDRIKPGSWYFDATQHELVYVPRHRRFLVTAKPGDYAIRWRVTAVRSRTPPQGSEPVVESLALTLKDGYRWEWPE
jgi:type II secretory pathway pseudopilin PulG